MKIAVPTRGKVVDNHFGHCEMYTLFTISENNQIVDTEILPSLQGCGCKSDIAAILQEKGVKVMLAGNMGNGAFNILQNHGIEVYRGCSGDVVELTKAFVQGNIKDSGDNCQHHEHHHGEHQCNH